MFVKALKFALVKSTFFGNSCFFTICWRIIEKKFGAICSYVFWYCKIRLTQIYRKNLVMSNISKMVCNLCFFLSAFIKSSNTTSFTQSSDSFSSVFNISSCPHHNNTGQPTSCETRAKLFFNDTNLY